VVATNLVIDSIVKEDDFMLGIAEPRAAANRQYRHHRASKATVSCEALEGRQLLSRGLGLDAFGGGGEGRRSLMAELGSFGGGGPGAMFGGGSLGLRGGEKDPVFLLTASLLNSGSGSTSLSRSTLSSSAVQSAFQTLESDYNNDVSVGTQPTHASVGQLEDDLESIRKGTLTGSAASTAIQNDEAAILTSMGLSSTQISQIQSDLQAVQSAIQSASSSGTGSTTTGSTTTGSTTNTSTSSGSSTSTTTGSSTSTSSSSSGSSVQSALQTLQTYLMDNVPVSGQATNASIGQVEDDLDAIMKGTLTGSQAVTTLQTDTATVWSSMGLTQSQITQIQSDQAAVTSAIQANWSSSSSSTTSSSSSTTSSVSPTSIAGVEATMKSVQSYLIDLPGVGGQSGGGYGGQEIARFGGAGGGGFAGSGRGGSTIVQMSGEGEMAGGGGFFSPGGNGP
jgi:hypothetical protein